VPKIAPPAPAGRCDTEREKPRLAGLFEVARPRLELGTPRFSVRHAEPSNAHESPAKEKPRAWLSWSECAAIASDCVLFGPRMRTRGPVVSRSPLIGPTASLRFARVAPPRERGHRSRRRSGGRRDTHRPGGSPYRRRSRSDRRCRPIRPRARHRDAVLDVAAANRTLGGNEAAPATPVLTTTGRSESSSDCPGR
jgi:hypothetical protein